MSRYMENGHEKGCTSAEGRDIMSLPRVGPYIGVSRDARTAKNIDGKKRTFRLIVYGAYDAMGLIGTECNGVAVLDEDNMQVLADEIGCTGTGYFGPSESQWSIFVNLKRMTGKRFQAFINSCKRNRYSI